MTLLSIHTFIQENLDVVIYEVGLGGRLDATNILTPKICGITTIGYDHMELLGK
jgi:folylpolyglutamate synthase/dihydropteroate synthase